MYPYPKLVGKEWPNVWYDIQIAVNPMIGCINKFDHYKDHRICQMLHLAATTPPRHLVYPGGPC